MIENININISSGNLVAYYDYNSISYCLKIYGFLLPKDKELYPYVLSLIELECH